MPGEPIVVVDDELSMREFLAILLRQEGYQVRAFPSAEEALVAVETEWPRLVLTDLNMPGEDGIDLLKNLKARAATLQKDVSVVVVTAYGTTESAIEAMRMGASDYVLKPFNNDELRLVVRKALGLQELEAENLRLKLALKGKHHFGQLVGDSESMKRIYEMVRQVKDTKISVLIEGESGTGKEMVARAIHYSGVRRDAPFVAVNCGAIPENLIESELFGHKRGSFTGAVQDKVGLMQAADGGTLFLDEVATLPAAAQVTLLRALQERTFLPVGGVKEVEVDVRVIAATNVKLQDAVAEGAFREDLYYRLNVVRMTLPPLRERSDDIPALARHFVQRFAGEYQKNVVGIAPDAMELLRAYHYPGNIRELQNVLERAVALANGALITPDDLDERVRAARSPEQAAEEEADPTFPPEGVNLDARLSAIERRWLLAALDATGGNRTRAATLLQMSFRSFRYRLAKYGLDIED
jgi:two-component system response regulator PilR (NtrC family)